MPLNGEAAVVSVSEWQSTQPMPGSELVPNNARPWSSDDDAVVGVGGAKNRMNPAKLRTSDDIWLAVPVVPPGGSGLTMLVESSGVGLNSQPGAVSRSFGKFSLDTPCSTLYASPAKMSKDLFCAFHPKRVTAWSFPVRFKRPKIPRLRLRVE